MPIITGMPQSQIAQSPVLAENFSAEVEWRFAHYDCILVEQVRSRAGQMRKQRAALLGLGLKGRHRAVVIPNQPSHTGQLKKVWHLVVVEFLHTEDAARLIHAQRRIRRTSYANDLLLQYSSKSSRVAAKQARKRGAIDPQKLPAKKVKVLPINLELIGSLGVGDGSIRALRYSPLEMEALECILQPESEKHSRALTALFDELAAQSRPRSLPSQIRTVLLRHLLEPAIETFEISARIVALLQGADTDDAKDVALKVGLYLTKLEYSFSQKTRIEGPIIEGKIFKVALCFRNQLPACYQDFPILLQPTERQSRTIFAVLWGEDIEPKTQEQEILLKADGELTIETCFQATPSAEGPVMLRLDLFERGRWLDGQSFELDAAPADL